MKLKTGSATLLAIVLVLGALYYINGGALSTRNDRDNNEKLVMFLWTSETAQNVTILYGINDTIRPKKLKNSNNFKEQASARTGDVAFIIVELQSGHNNVGTCEIYVNGTVRFRKHSKSWDCRGTYVIE